jgi:L-amino acid N-acyltransferase YncA
MPGIQAIHNQVVAHSDAVFGEELQQLEERVAWWRERTEAGRPVLVVEDERGVAGFGSYAQFRPWPGYRDTVEHTVHVREDARRKGIGRALVLTLIEHARKEGLHVMVAGVDGANAPSVALHESMGFQQVARMPEVGIKHGRRLDLVLLQVRLD